MDVQLMRRGRALLDGHFTAASPDEHAAGG
jgi:hypothetical protein